MKKSSTGWLVTTIVVIIVISSTCLPIFGTMWCDYRAVQKGHGKAALANWVGEGDGAGLLVLEAVEQSGGSDALRLAVLDPATGALRARRILDETEARCRNAAAGRIWCWFDKHLRLLDAKTLQDLASEDQLLKQSPLFHVGLSSFVPQVDPANGSLVVGTNDGLRAEIDPVSLAARQVSENTNFPAMTFEADGEDDNFATAEFTIRPEGNASTDRQVLVRVPNDGGEKQPLGLQVESAATPGAAPVPRGSYLKIKFLQIQKGATGLRFEPDGPPGFIMLHQDSLDDQLAKRLVSRLDFDGRVLWTVERTFAAVKAGFALPDRLILVFQDPVNQALAVDLPSGRVLWTFDY